MTKPNIEVSHHLDRETPPFGMTAHFKLNMSRSSHSKAAGSRQPGGKEGKSALSAQIKTPVLT